MESIRRDSLSREALHISRYLHSTFGDAVWLSRQAFSKCLLGMCFSPVEDVAQRLNVTKDWGLGSLLAQGSLSTCNSLSDIVLRYRLSEVDEFISKRERSRQCAGNAGNSAEMKEAALLVFPPQESRHRWGSRIACAMWVPFVFERCRRAGRGSVAVPAFLIEHASRDRIVLFGEVGSTFPHRAQHIGLALFLAARYSSLTLWFLVLSARRRWESGENPGLPRSGKQERTLQSKHWFSHESGSWSK